MPPHRSKIDRALIAALCSWAAVGSISVVLVGRAIAGAFDEPVSAAFPLLTTGLTLCGSLAAWTLFHWDVTRNDVGRRLLDGILSLLPAGMAGFSSAVNAGPMTLAAATGLLVCGLSYVIAREGTRTAFGNTARSATPLPVDDLRAGSPSPSLDSDGPAKTEAATRTPDWETSAEVRSSAMLDHALATESPEQQLPTERRPDQQVFRRTLPDGSEEIEAVLLATFAPGERRVALHLPIQPVIPLPVHVECEPIEDANVVVTATSVYRYGVRLEVQRSESIHEAAEVVVGVLVQTSQTTAAAPAA